MVEEHKDDIDFGSGDSDTEDNAAGMDMELTHDLSSNALPAPEKVWLIPDHPAFGLPEDARLAKAVEMVRVQRGTYQTSIDAWGVTMKKLRTALQPGGKKKRGRKNLLDDDGVALLAQRATERTLNLDSARNTNAGENFFLEVLRETAPNSIAAPKGCKTSRRTYFLKAGITKQSNGEVKNLSRQKAYLNIRTSISMAAMMRCIYRKCHPRVIHSSDDFSVLLNSFDDTPTLLTTKVAKKIMKEINVGVSTSQNRGKRRIVVFNGTISYFGITCKVLRFSDRNFTAFRKMPKIFDMGDHFFVILHHPDLSDKKVTELLYLKCIIPSAVESREQAIRAAFEPLREVMCSQSSAASSAAAVALEDELGQVRSAVQELQLELAEEEAREEERADEEVNNSDGEDDNAEEDVESEHNGEEEASGDGDVGGHGGGSGSHLQSSTAADFVRNGDLPAARAHLQQFASPVVDPDHVGDAGASSSSQPAAAVSDGTAAQSRYTFLALLFDGAIPQIQALLGKVNKKCIEKNLPAVMGKTPGGASLTTGTNDAGDMHKASHSLFGSALKGYREYAEPDERQWRELKSLLQDQLDPDSFRTLWKCVRAAPHILSDTFKTTTLQKAFHMAGTLVVRSSDNALVPDDVVMLSHCPDFCKLNDRKAAFVLSTIPKFAAIMETNGFISEDEFQRILGGESDVDNCPPKSGVPLELMSTSRQRACIINSRGWLTHMQMVQDYKEEMAYQKMLREELREKKKQQELLEEEGDRPRKAARTGTVRGHGKRCISFPTCPRYKGDDGRTDKHACKDWCKCVNKYCQMWACSNPECRGVLDIHSDFECRFEKPTEK